MAGHGKVKDSKTHKVLVGFMKLKEKDKDKDDSGGGAKKSSAAKEKLAGKQSLQIQAQGSAELIEAERASPQTMAKRKSTSVDIISMPTAGVVLGGSEQLLGMKQLAPLSNGGVMLGGDDKGGVVVGGGMGSLDALVDRNGGTVPLEGGESFDSGNEMSLNNNNNIHNNNNAEKSVLDMKTHGSIQVSQV